MIANKYDNVREYLQDMYEVIEKNSCYDENDDDANKEIAHFARQYPKRAFIVPLNLEILLDNYQDKDSEFLEHPKWIMEMINVLKEIDDFLSENSKNNIESGSNLHHKVKKCLELD